MRIPFPVNFGTWLLANRQDHLKAHATDMLLFLGLNGKTNLEAAKIDMLCDGVRDIFDKMFALLYHETDPERKVTT